MEHAYQAARTPDERLAEIVRTCCDPVTARRYAYRAIKRPEWDQIRRDVMLGLVRQELWEADRKRQGQPS